MLQADYFRKVGDSEGVLKMTGELRGHELLWIPHSVHRSAERHNLEYDERRVVGVSVAQEQEVLDKVTTAH